jgi:DNA (cytosine-5)-methyltransferase 1
MRPRLLDLFCGAGGAAMGYHRAGFDVVGVDIEPQPHYPFEFIHNDALDVLRAFNRHPDWHDLAFDAIHASPPCQAYTSLSNRWRGRDSVADNHPDLIAETRRLLEETGLPWVIENVVGASKTMRATLLLDGGMFGLGVHRPRLFESSVLILSPGRGTRGEQKIGVYGKSPDGRQLNYATGQRGARSLEEAQEAMGMDWADWHGTKEAIPPAYTEWIGAQLLRHLELAPIQEKP